MIFFLFYVTTWCIFSFRVLMALHGLLFLCQYLFKCWLSTMPLHGVWNFCAISMCLVSVSSFDISLSVWTVFWNISSILPLNLLILHSVVSYLPIAHNHQFFYVNSHDFTKTLIIFSYIHAFFFCITSYSWYMCAIPYFIYLETTILTLKLRCIYEVISSGINSHFWNWYSSYVL